MSLHTSQSKPHIDRSPKTPAAGRFHPGWLVLAIAGAAIFMSAPGQSYSVAVFLERMLEDLRMSRTEYSIAYGLATLLGGLTLPWLGRMVDRHGARTMLPLVAVLLGFACLWMSRIENLLALVVGFSMIRCLGQGSLTLIGTWLVGEWFERRRGLAMGVVGLGGTLSVMVFPQLNNVLISQIGWRGTWVVLAVAVWAVLVLPGIVLVRNRPEDLGLLPDGGRPDPEVPEDLGQTAGSQFSDRDELANYRAASFTPGEAVRTTSFWKLMAVLCTGSLVGTGLVFHQLSLLGAHGVTTSQAVWLLGLQAVVGTACSIVAGYLTDRMPARYLLSAAMVFLTSALLVLLWMPSPVFAIAYSSLLGLHGGIMRSTGTVVWINYYGRIHQGAVWGVALSIAILAAALGPFPLALAMDVLGGYEAALLAFLAMPVLSACVVYTAHKPVKAKHIAPAETAEIDTPEIGTAQIDRATDAQDSVLAASDRLAS